MDLFDLREWNNKSLNDSLFIDDVSIDSRAIHSSKTLFIALQGSRGDGHAYVGNALAAGSIKAVVSKDYIAPPFIREEQLIRVSSTIDALQEIATAYRNSIPNLTLVAVSGSCGKTMLKDLLGHLFEGPTIYTSPESFNSQIGVALSLLSIPRKTTLAFIEMAANRPGEMSRLVSMTKPTMALITNFSRKRVGTIEKQRFVANELFFLISSLPPSGFAVVEKDPQHPIKDVSCPVFYWNEDTSIVCSQGSVVRGRLPITIHYKDESTHTLSITGNHLYLVELITIALSFARKMGVSTEKIIQTLTTYQPDLMRTEIWKNQSGTSFVNGTYCHTPLSFDASLDELRGYIKIADPSVRGKTILVFGGLRKASEHMKRIAESIVAHGISDVHVWPKTVGESLSPFLSDRVNVSSYTTIEEAIIGAKRIATALDTVIFKGPRKLPFNWLIEQLEESPPSTIACINLAAIRTNIEVIRASLQPNTRIMVMVKALAYGTDDIRISHFLRSCGVDILGASYVNEAVVLRQMGVTQSLFVIHASPSEMNKAAHWNVEVGVSSQEQINAAIEAAKSRDSIVKVHLHVDTGMKRFGCQPNEALMLAQLIQRSPYLVFEGLFTHFSSADDPREDAFTKHQAETLIQIQADLKAAQIHPRYTHAANSSAAMRFVFPEFNMVRLGLATYGFHTSDASLHNVDLRPALSLMTHIAGFNHASAGETVSYGRTHVVTQPKARLAVLPIGFYDGIHRSYSGKGSVLIRGRQAPMVGKVCMDYMMVDVSHINDASVGDQALLFGEDERGAYLSPESLAKAGGSIVHELITCLGPRVQRLFIYDESLLTR